jgi:hypothetical protein
LSTVNKKRRIRREEVRFGLARNHSSLLKLDFSFSASGIVLSDSSPRSVSDPKDKINQILQRA